MESHSHAGIHFAQVLAVLHSNIIAEAAMAVLVCWIILHLLADIAAGIGARSRLMRELDLGKGHGLETCLQAPASCEAAPKLNDT